MVIIQSTSNPADDHHYIPRFYTKKWATNRLLTIYQLTEAGVYAREGAPKSTGYLSKLYSMENVPPEDAADIEKEFFAPADNLAERAMHALLKGNTLHDERYRVAWTQYVMGLLIRCPEDLKLIRENWMNYLIQVPPHWELAYNETRRHDDPLTLAEKIKQVTPAAKEKSMFRAYLSLFNHANVINFVKNMRWFVKDVSTANWTLLTSDRPVSRTNGLDVPYGHLALAISPTKLFCAARDQETARWLRQAPPNVIVRNYNHQVTAGAVRFVYSINRDQTSFVNRWIGTDPQRRLVEGFFKSDRVVKLVDEKSDIEDKKSLPHPTQALLR